MGLSETILAAMIGAIATVTTAFFHVFSSIKGRNKIEVKPRRGSTMRSVVAVLALMIASAAGGFLYSELLKQGDREDLRALRTELRELKEITAAARTPVTTQTSAYGPESLHAGSPLPVNLVKDPQAVESVAYVPACRRTPVEGQLPLACSEAEAQRIALCGSIPSYARIASIELFAQPDAVQKPWDEHRVTLEQDLGGARFTGKSFEYAQGAELKAVCVNFMQWSSDHSHIARIVVNYAFGDAPAAAPPGPRGAAPAVIAADALPTMPQQASFVTSTKP